MKIEGRAPGIRVRVWHGCHLLDRIRSPLRSASRPLGSSNIRIAAGCQASERRTSRRQDPPSVKLQRIVDTQTGKIRQQRDELAQLAPLDPLTNLANRRKFLECLEGEMARARRSRRPLALLMMDIDHFKLINDTYGHAAGDEVLKSVALRGARSIRETDTLARWGGDEFILLMPETNRDEARQTAVRLKESIQSEAFVLADGRALNVTLSLGVTSRPVGGEGLNTPESLLQEADALLYRAKVSGRNAVES